jgi:hypothetical protein
VSADLRDYGSAPHRILADGVEVYRSSKQSKAIAWGTQYAEAHPDVLVELKYKGGRWVLDGASTPDPDPAPEPEPTPDPEPEPEPEPEPDPTPDPTPDPDPDPPAGIRVVATSDSAVTVEATWTDPGGWDILTGRGDVRINYTNIQSPYTFDVTRDTGSKSIDFALEKWTDDPTASGTYIETVALGSITVPALDSDPVPSPPPPPPPPPPATGGAYRDYDFASYADDAALFGDITVHTQGNVHADPGVGMRYDFQPRPTHCGDQTLTSQVDLPAGTRDLWLRAVVRFSPNWTNDNPNCSSPQPDYKMILSWLKNRPKGGRRFDFKPGTANSYWSCLPPGWATYQAAPLGTCQPGRGGSAPVALSDLWDGGWHTIEIRQQITSGPDRALYQCRIDGTVLANYRTGYSEDIGLAGNSIGHIAVGANRNLGATSLMQLWWRSLTVWTDVTGAPDATVFPAFPTPTQHG